ncbi:MAG: methyltransferase domain-containing protein [Amaricoccus sp.]
MTIAEIDTRAAWDRIAPGYDRTNTPTQMWLGEEGLKRAGLQPGMRFLDVAAGSGALAIPAARRGAQVLAADQSPAMLALLGRRAEAEGLAVETRVMDGHALTLGDGSFDMAGSQFGVMLFPDMPRGIREMARVVRPGGRVLVITYGDPREVDFIGFLVTAVRAVRPGFTGPPLDPAAAALPAAATGAAGGGARRRGADRRSRRDRRRGHRVRQRGRALGLARVQQSDRGGDPRRPRPHGPGARNRRGSARNARP